MIQPDGASNVLWDDAALHKSWDVGVVCELGGHNGRRGHNHLNLNRNHIGAAFLIYISIQDY